MLRDLADQRDVFSFYLAVISYVNSTCNVKTGKDVDDSCPKGVFHSVRFVDPVLSSRPSLMSGYWLATSVFHFSLDCFGLAVLSRETLLFSRRIQAPDDKISPR